MKSKRKNVLALSLTAIGAIGAFASVSAESIQGNFPGRVRDEVRSAIKQAFTSADYQAYLLTTKEYKVGVPVLTESQFNAMVEANKLRANGDIAGAKKVLDGSGIKPQGIEGKGRMGDKNGFLKNTTNLTDEQKKIVEQSHVLRQNGKSAEADTLLKNAGIALPERINGKGYKTMKPFIPNLTDSQKLVMEQAHILMESGKKTEADTLLKNAGITLSQHRGQMYR